MFNEELFEAEIHGHGGPGVCLGDGQMDAEGVPSQDGRGDALLRRMPPYLAWYTVRTYQPVINGEDISTSGTQWTSTSDTKLR